MGTRFIERIAVEVDGPLEGPPVVLLDGLGGTSNSFAPLLGGLARFRCIRVDLPGSGRSHAVEGAVPIPRQIELLHQVFANFEIERAHFVGHCLGAAVALHLAAAQPDRVATLSLLGPVVNPSEAVRANLRSRAAKARWERVNGMQIIADAVVATALARQTRAGNTLAAALVRESLMRQDPDGYARCCDALVAAPAFDPHAVSCPTLLIAGDEDSMSPVDDVRALAGAIPRCTLEILEHCGHWPTLEWPERCTALIRDFLDR